VIENGKHKTAGQQNYPAIDRKLINVTISDHGQRYAEVPEGTDEEKAAKKVVIKFSSPREDKSHNGAIQEEANKRCY
jgi:hypothetical protein